MGCCCDPDCDDTVDRVEVFGCVKVTSPRARAGVSMCEEDLVNVNLPASAKADGWESETDADGALCIVYDNSASRGAFYDDPTSDGAMDAREVNDEIEDNSPTTYATWQDDLPASPLPAGGNYVLREDTVVVCDASAGSGGCPRAEVR